MEATMSRHTVSITTSMACVWAIFLCIMVVA